MLVATLNVSFAVTHTEVILLLFNLNGILTVNRFCFSIEKYYS